MATPWPTKHRTTKTAPTTISKKNFRKRTFSQFLSATIGPPVARVSAPKHTPSGSSVFPPPNLTPTMVVPVDVAVRTGVREWVMRGRKRRTFGECAAQTFAEELVACVVAKVEAGGWSVHCGREVEWIQRMEARMPVDGRQMTDMREHGMPDCSSTPRHLGL